MDKKMADLIKFAQSRGISLNFGAAGPPTNPRREKKVSAERRIYYLDEHEIGRLFVVLREHGTARDVAIFTLAYHRGLRASEVGRLRMSDYRASVGRLYVTRLKGSSSGEYLLTEPERRALAAWLRERGSGGGPLFPSRNRRPISRRRLDELAKHYMELAQIDASKRMFKSMRHSCATALVDRDVDLLQVADVLGHKDVKNTQVYARVRAKKRDELSARLAKGMV